MLPATFVKGFHDEASVRKMKYNILGNTGLEVSQLSLGGGVFSPLYEKFSEEEAIETIVAAIKQGINYIDTAPWYGQGQSETILGKALSLVPREAYYIGTKVGRYNLDFESMFDFSSKKTLSSVDKSLSLLGLSYVDIIQVHDIEFAPSIEIILNETLPTLAKIRDQGKAKFIGVTGYPLSVLKQAVDSSPFPLNTILTYCRNTLIDNTLDDYINHLQEKKVGIINACSHCMGMLTNNGPQCWHPAPKEVLEKCKMASEYCKEKGVEFGKLAMCYSIATQGVSTHLVGMSNRKLLEYNMTVILNGLTQKEQDTLEEVKIKFLNSIKNKNWEGVELEKYRSYMNSDKKINNSKADNVWNVL